jgi:septum formation protein
MLILASTSPTRQRLLASAGIPFLAIPAPIDEREIENNTQDKSPEAVSLLLAQAKAIAVSRTRPDAYVIGADQLLTCKGQRFHKPMTTGDAKSQLLALRGHTHELHTALCIFQNGACLSTHVSTPKLTMRSFSDSFLETYLQTQSNEVLRSAGCYRYEETGIQLFSQIEGDMHSILGLPLIPVLNFLRAKDLLPS